MKSGKRARSSYGKRKAYGHGGIRSRARKFEKTRETAFRNFHKFRKTFKRKHVS